MNLKTQLHTLFVKHDSQFKTLTKIALSQVILKIIHFGGKKGISIIQIQQELKDVIPGNVELKDVEAAIDVLKREGKVNAKAQNLFISSTYSKQIIKFQEESNGLHDSIIKKYFNNAESNIADIKKWFQHITISFFETFSFEWFLQKTQNGRNSANTIPNLANILDRSFTREFKILEGDKEWLKHQYKLFVDSDAAEENLIFWQYGMSMFSSRLITANTYADQLSIEMFKESKFVLDTNILMILDLEEHELANSLRAMEQVLIKLGVTLVYFGVTREEFLRAMNWRKEESLRIFEGFELEILKASDCPYIRTAINRECKTTEDIERMFDVLMDLPKVFQEKLEINKYEYTELNDAIEKAQQDENLKTAINDIYKKRTNRDKRENPILHDAGMIGGIKYLRNFEKCWIITNDSTLKVFALQNPVRDEPEFAVGLDVILGILAVNSGGVDIEASNFAPLFKNLIKHSLEPATDAFAMNDLAFILNSHIKVNELPNEKVIEVAKEVKKMRIAGESNEDISLHLRRVLEGEKLSFSKDIYEAKQRESIANNEKEKVERQNEALINNFRINKKAELRTKYDNELFWNRIKMFSVPLIIGAIIFVSIRWGIESNDKVVAYIVGVSVEVIFALLAIFPYNKHIRKRYKSYVTDIDNIVEMEIDKMRNKAN